MEIISNLPNEIKWNIFKYMRHPVAEVFTQSEDVQVVASAMCAYNEGPGLVRNASFTELWFEVKGFDEDVRDFVKQEIAFLLSDEYLNSGKNEQNCYEEFFLSTF